MTDTIKLPQLLSPVNGTVIDAHTPIQNEFIQRIQEEGTDAALEWLLPIKANIERSHPAPLQFSWSDTGTGGYRFELSETDDFSCPMILETEEATCTVTNLKIGQTYYWRVNNSRPFCFETLANHYRFIQVDGAVNIRDIGGIHIKQGMFYRGSEIDAEFKLTPEGKHTFYNQLKIKTELDIRQSSRPIPPHCAASENIAYLRLPYRPYLEVFEDEHRKGVCKIMDFLSQEGNYPVYCHCLGGADRTGMVALFLRALLEEPDELILIDYELTSLSIYAAGLTEGVRARGFRNRNNDYFAEFIKAMAVYAPGGTLAQQVKCFLLDCGVTEETIEKIIHILRK